MDAGKPPNIFVMALIRALRTGGAAALAFLINWATENMGLFHLDATMQAVLISLLTAIGVALDKAVREQGKRKED